MDTTELCFTPATELGRLIRGRALSPVELVDAVLAPTMVDRLAFTFPFNLTGQPAATVPCGFTAEGLPVGLQIVGRWHADATVLRAAAGFEALQPWAETRPPLE